MKRILVGRGNHNIFWFQSISILAMRSNKRQETVSVLSLITKLHHYVELNLLAFLKEKVK